MFEKVFSSTNRIILTRIIIATLVLYVLFNHPPEYFPRFILEMCEMIGLVFLVAATLGRIWCLIFVGGKKNDVLMTFGPYSVVRNPLYVFSFIGAVGLGLTVENPLLALLLAVLFMAYYQYVVKKEERRLSTLFGPEYSEYLARTPRWFPNFSLYSEPETISVNTVYIRKGILGSMWFIWAYLLWELLELITSSGFWPYWK